ncbi:hypothetical protein [Natronococcus wangiae]|uniref:hypothetical protein n=1 Tax=Natronococcus wangiae TaxID=3068275 RepID=UPI00387EB2E9
MEPARRQDADLEDPIEEPVEEPDAVVSSHEPRPGKVVFTERNNTDGWIATDLAVDLEP